MFWLVCILILPIAIIAELLKNTWNKYEPQISSGLYAGNNYGAVSSQSIEDGEQRMWNSLNDDTSMFWSIIGIANDRVICQNARFFISNGNFLRLMFVFIICVSLKKQFSRLAKTALFVYISSASGSLPFCFAICRA